MANGDFGRYELSTIHWYTALFSCITNSVEFLSERISSLCVVSRTIQLELVTAKKASFFVAFIAVPLRYETFDGFCAMQIAKMAVSCRELSGGVHLLQGISSLKLVFCVRKSIRTTDQSIFGHVATPMDIVVHLNAMKTKRAHKPLRSRTRGKGA